MSVTTDKGRFFQTSLSLAEDARKARKSANTYGDPIKFSSKLLAITLADNVDSNENIAFVAEAGGVISHVNIGSAECRRIGKASQAPLTAIAAYNGKLSAQDSASQNLVFAGGWDKSITKCRVESLADGGVNTTDQSSFQAHSDFVKCLVVAKTPDEHLVLISGGADGDINIWTFDGARLAKLRPQSRGIENIALDPFSTPQEPRVFFATSKREIYSFQLPKTSDMAKIAISEPILQHETSVYKIHFDNDGDMWTCSADKTAKRLVRENNFVADTTLVHPDFVRDVVTYDASDLVLTACRDEEVRVWQAGSGQMLHIFTGHYEEVTGLALRGSTLISVSIDATLRKWSLAPQDLQKSISEARNPNLEEELPEPKNDFGELTEEEEAELRALMEEEEADTLEKMVQGTQ